MAVESVEVHSRLPYLVPNCSDNFEQLTGTVHFAVDPEHEANRAITDLEFAAGKDGLVRFHADLVLIEPTNVGAPSPLVYVVANRGRTGVLPFNYSEITNPSPGSSINAGDGFVLRHGFSVMWCGWQWDVEASPGAVRLDPPLAVIDGAAPIGRIELQIEVGAPIDSHVLVDTRTGAGGILPYPAAGTDQAELVCVARGSGERVRLEKGSWDFGRIKNGGFIPDPRYLYVAGGLLPGSVYHLSFQPGSCPVNGAGLLATRDVVSMLRYGRDDALGKAARPLSHTLMFGFSQSGRYQREFLCRGLNVDEQQRNVFDAMFIDVAAARRGEFNARYGQLSTNRSEGIGLEPPYALSHPGGGLLDRQREAGSVPKIFSLNAAWEYWRRDGAALHIETDGSADLLEDPDTRCYSVAGASHVTGAGAAGAVFPPANPTSTIERAPIVRALALALIAWLGGKEPPPSVVPRVAENSAVGRSSVLEQLRTIPGLALPDLEMISPTSLTHPGEELTFYPDGVPVEDRLVALVSHVDEDGNELAGIRLPEVAVPIATHLGYNPRRVALGEAAPVVDLVGTSFPFPVSETDRARSADPRASLESRYASVAVYQSLLGQCADELITRGFLLEEDRAEVIARARRRYEALGPPTSNGREQARAERPVSS